MGESDRTRIGTEQRRVLLQWAEAQRFTSTFGARPDDDYYRLLGLEGSVAGNEHSVVFPQSSGRVIKITHPDKFGKAYPIVDGIPTHSNATPLEYLDRLLLSNQVFSDEVRLERVVIDQEGAMRLITSQPLVVGTQPDDVEVHDALRDLGFDPFESVDGKPMTNDWFRELDQVLAFDAHAGNFIKTSEGFVLAIDIYVEAMTGTNQSASPR